jgi:hypothetical protein
MRDESTNLFLTSMIGAVFKVLPLYDSNNETLPDYIESLYIQLIGGRETYEDLKLSQEYTTIINVIQYFRANEYSKKTCKREILKCVNLLEKLSKR